MKHTAKQTTRQTLTDLYRALGHQRAVTITYLDHDGTETIRTIEIIDIRTTSGGHIQVRAMCRLRGDARSFDLARIVSYTCHRAAYVLDHTEAATPAGTTTAPRSAAAVIARELGRDYLPARRIARTDTALAA